MTRQVLWHRFAEDELTEAFLHDGSDYPKAAGGAAGGRVAVR
jgi:hypothetical protein